MSNSIDQMCEVLCRRNPIDTRPRRFARLQVRQQCRTPSTNRMSMMSNSIDTSRSRYATVSRVQQCRTPSTNCASTMSNSIYSPSPVNSVELHQLPKLTRPVFSLEIAVELRHGELSSCATYTLNNCNLLPRGLVLRPIQRESKVFKSNF